LVVGAQMRLEHWDVLLCLTASLEHTGIDAALCCDRGTGADQRALHPGACPHRAAILQHHPWTDTGIGPNRHAISNHHWANELCRAGDSWGVPIWRHAVPPEAREAALLHGPRIGQRRAARCPGVLRTHLDRQAA